MGCHTDGRLLPQASVWDGMGWGWSDMSHQQIYNGECFCGAVGFTARGAPVASGYCHCESCRQWSAAPMNACTLWRPESVTVTRGASCVGTFKRTSNSLRKWCTSCGGHLFTEHPRMGLIDIYAAVLPQLQFSPGVHVNYHESVLRIPDGLPKFNDLPKEMGGSGVTLPE